MIFTSYFANWRFFPEKLKPICIAKYPPKNNQMSCLPKLCPSSQLLKAYKQGKVDDKGYADVFNKQLDQLDVRKAGLFLQNCILICYEKPEDFCHRHLIAKWLNDNDYETKELRPEDILNC